MNIKDYSWDKQSALNDEVIDAEAMPERFALTAPQVVMRDGSKEILLVDPHASGTWETWMFPYASLILTVAEVDSKCKNAQIEQINALRGLGQITFGSLSAALQQLRGVFSAEYSAAIATGVNNVLPQLQGGWNGTAFHENYSLKFSKTSKSYTAYDFHYYINKVDNIDLKLPHVWVNPTKLQLHLNNSKSFEGRPVSSNVIDALSAIINYTKANSADGSL